MEVVAGAAGGILDQIIGNELDKLAKGAIDMFKKEDEKMKMGPSQQPESNKSSSFISELGDSLKKRLRGSAEEEDKTPSKPKRGDKKMTPAKTQTRRNFFPGTILTNALPKKKKYRRYKKKFY